MPSLSELYHWVDDAHNLDWSVAVIRGHEPDMVVSTYGGTPSQPQQMTYVEAKAWRNAEFNQHGVIQVKQLDHAIVVFEPNGWASSIAELARCLSAEGSQFISVYWSPSAYQVLEAIDGRVTALFDPIYVEPGEDKPRDGEVYPAWITGSEFLDDGRIRSNCLALLEDRTGVRVEQGWLEEPLSSYAIPDPDAGFGTDAGVRLP